MADEVSLNIENFRNEISDIQDAAALLETDITVPVPLGNMETLNNMLTTYSKISDCMTRCRGMGLNTASNMKRAAASFARMDKNLIR